MNARKLRLSYRRLGIWYKNVDLKRGGRRPYQYDLLLQDQQKLDILESRLLGKALSNGAIVFLDECVFTTKSYKPMAWSSKGTNISQSQLLKLQPCVAVLAAVSIDRGLILFHQKNKSFNSALFIDFLTDLRTAIGHVKPIEIVLDNCKIHCTLKAREAAQ